MRRLAASNASVPTAHFAPRRRTVCGHRPVPCRTRWRRPSRRSSSWSADTRLSTPRPACRPWPAPWPSSASAASA